MNKAFTILIADRNPHIREFLKREMLAEGYRPQLVKNGREVLQWINDEKPLDLLILDLDLPDIVESALLERLKDRSPALPVVVHTYLQEYVTHPHVLSAAVLVEKSGDSIDLLKKAVSETLRRSYPGH